MARALRASAVIDRLVKNARAETQRRTLRRLVDGDWPASSTVIELYGSWAAARADALPDD
jgi:hypothetical protein